MLNGLGIPDRKAKAILPAAGIEGKGNFVWRHCMTDGYKIGQSYKDVPLELSHFLLIRTREHLLLQNKLNNRVFKPKHFSSLTSNFNNQSISNVRRDLEEGM